MHTRRPFVLGDARSLALKSNLASLGGVWHLGLHGRHEDEGEDG